MKRFVTAVAVATLALSGSACATKKMVKQRVGEVNDKVDTLSKSVEENQERTKTNETKIGDVDQRAQAASQRAYGRADEAYVAAEGFLSKNPSFCPILWPDFDYSYRGEQCPLPLPWPAVVEASMVNPASRPRPTTKDGSQSSASAQARGSSRRRRPVSFPRPEA